MTTVRDRLAGLMPLPYAVGSDSVLGQLLDVFAVELEAYAEDLDRLRRTHWRDLAYRLSDLERLAALVGITRLPWEDLATFHTRLRALVPARLAGAVGPAEIRGFVHAYLTGAQKALTATLVPGLDRYDDPGEAFAPDPRFPAYRPPALVENPERRRRSQSLADRGGRVPYLHRWQDHNRGLAEAVARCTVTGMSGGRTAVPVLANLTTGDLIGYDGVLPAGQRLRVEPAGGADPRTARAVLDDDQDVTGRLFSMSGFQLSTPFRPRDREPAPRLPRMARGANDWVLLCVGLYGTPGLDHVFFAVAGPELREGTFDEARFDQALFPSGPVARVELGWTELEPAAFQVRVPRHLVIERSGTPSRLGEVTEALGAGVAELRAAGVRAEVVYQPFAETQRQRDRVRLPWIVLPREPGPSGVDGRVALGARFGESAFASTRFE